MSIMSRTVPGLIAMAATIGVVAVPSAAHADGTATGSVAVGREYGDLRRAEFRTKGDGSGYVWNTYGSSQCSADYQDNDFYKNTLSNGWSNDIAWVKDFAHCDTALYNEPSRADAFYHGNKASGYNGMYHDCVLSCTGSDLLTWTTYVTELYARNRAESYSLS